MGTAIVHGFSPFSISEGRDLQRPFCFPQYAPPRFVLEAGFTVLASSDWPGEKGASLFDSLEGQPNYERAFREKRAALSCLGSLA